MHIMVDVHKIKSRLGFAKVNLSCDDMKLKSTIDFDFSALSQYLNHSCEDLLFIATIVYCVDKLALRSMSLDKWTRELKIELPVTAPERLLGIKRDLEQLLSFLTGDIWEVNFKKSETHVFKPTIKTRKTKLEKNKPAAVCLFSGGLDSLIGAIDWLEMNPKDKLLLVGHHDGSIAGPSSDQTSLFEILREYYKDRVDILKIRVGQNPGGYESTYRSRSFLFLSLGIYVANFLGEKTPLLIPENGLIAINPPLTSSRRGACSTRTAHPIFLGSMRSFLENLSIRNPIINPLETKTKGECIETCLNKKILIEAIPSSVSCAKRGHRRAWKNRHADSCGFCVPCIYRRAALHKNKLAIETYGLDICGNDIDIHSSAGVANDLRACVLFIQEYNSKEKIQTLLLSNGIISIDDASRLSQLILRGIEEVRLLLVEKGNEDLK